MRSGIATSEFWLTALAQLVAMLVLFGVVGSGDRAELLAIAEKIVVGVFAAVALWKYVASRTEIKTTEAAAEVAKHRAALSLRAEEQRTAQARACAAARTQDGEGGYRDQS